MVPEGGVGDEPPPALHHVPDRPEGAERPERPDPGRVASADVEELWTWIDHPDPAVQVQALQGPALTDEQLLALADPDRDFSVRFAVAIDHRPLAALYAADDPHPVMRVLVTGRDDCPAQLRDELLADPEVRALRQRIAASPLLAQLDLLRQMSDG